MDIVTKNCRLMKSEILRKKAEFNQIFSSASVKSSPSITLRYAKIPTGKIGFIVPKNIAHTAVVRNRIKRYLREIYRNNKEFFSADYSYVLQARENALKKNFHELRNEVLLLVGKIKNEN
jgi:ribonuclease P protein component